MSSNPAEPHAAPGTTWPGALLVGALCALGLGVVYGPLVVTDPVLARDDTTLLGGVRGLASPLDWPAAVRAGRVLDLQPVRDASFALDLALGRALGRGTFHATNLLLWAAILAVAALVLARACARVSPGSRSPLPEPWLAALPLLALHPLAVGSVAWISARKHLLAALFTLAATLLLLRAIERRDRRPRTVAALAALHLLAALSQPIALLWPLWGLLAVRLLAPPGERRRLSLLPAALLPQTGLLLAANAAYYTALYPRLTGSDKLLEAGAGLRLLSLGRYFLNVVVPLRLAAEYSPGSAWNLAGLLLLPVGLLLLARAGRREALLWSSFCAFPLSLVTLRMTNIFVSDTYALLPLLGACTGLCCALAQLQPLGRRAASAGLLCLALPAGFLAQQGARTFASDAALWAHAAAVEPSPDTLVRHGGQLLAQGQVGEARRLAEQVAATDPGARQLAWLLGRSTAADPSLPVEEKVRRLEETPVAGAWRDYFLATLLVRTGQRSRGLALLLRALDDPGAFKRELPLVAAEAQILCGQEQRDCGARLAALRASPGWSEAAFAARLRSAGSR